MQQDPDTGRGKEVQVRHRVTRQEAAEAVDTGRTAKANRVCCLNCRSPEHLEHLESTQVSTEKILSSLMNYIDCFYIRD